MNLKDVIKGAVLSEKAHKLTDKGATKKDVARAIDAQFSVTVKKVNLSKFAPKTKRISGSRKLIALGGGTKALVWLGEGQKIAMLSPKAKSAPKKKEKEIEKVSVEGKEG